MNEPTSPLHPITDAKLGDASAVKHAFFTRVGGHSLGIYKGLNVGLGSDDEREAVLANRALAAAYFSVKPTHLATPYQIHSPNVVIIDKPIGENRPTVDAVVTATPGIAVGVLTADCSPVLFSDPSSGIVAAAHAGWKGATEGVLENTIAAMQSLGASKTNIIAVLGPTICQKNYEVGPEFVENLMRLSSDNSKYLIPSTKPKHAMFDLANYVVERLSRAGVTAHWTGHCTYADEAQFYSYRRKMHRAESDYGRQLSAICLIQD